MIDYHGLYNLMTYTRSATKTTEVSGYLDDCEYVGYLRRQGKSDKEIMELMVEPPRFEFLEK